MYEAEDKAAEEIVLGARKHLFLCNNLYSVLNHVRDIIDKAEEAANGKKRAVSVNKNKQHRLAPFCKKVESRYVRVFIHIVICNNLVLGILVPVYVCMYVCMGKPPSFKYLMIFQFSSLIG